MDYGFLRNIFIFLAAACIAVPVASRLKLSSVLGYLIAGVIIGPFALKFIDNPEEIMHFAEFGVVMMLFVIGLELEPAMLWRLRKAILGLGSLQVSITSMVFAGIGIMLGYDWQVSLAAGMALALSSTALVLQMLNEKNLMQTMVGETAFSLLLFQDIVVIPILIVMPLLASHSIVMPHAHHGIFSEYPGWMQALAVAGVIGFLILAGRYLSHYVFDMIARTNLRELFTATSLMLIVGITLLMQLVGVSPALGAFVAGVVLANSEYKHTLETDIEPFKGLLLGLFFISVGMGMNFSIMQNQPGALFATVLCLMLVKACILWVLGRLFGLTPVHNAGFALALSQGGEFAFVLFQFAGSLEVLSAAQAAFLTLAVALSIGLTPLLMLFYNRKMVPRFMSLLPNREYDVVTENNNVILAGYGRYGQIIGRFLMAQGVRVNILEKDPDQITFLRKFGFKGFFGDATRLDLLQSAQADKAKLLIVAVDDAESCLEIVRLARREFPNLKIFARARNRRHAYELHKAGVHYFRRELFDSSLTMAQAIMETLGHNPIKIQYRAEQFMRHDEATLMKSFEFFENEPELINFARFRTAELENILKSDMMDGEQELKERAS